MNCKDKYYAQILKYYGLTWVDDVYNEYEKIKNIDSLFDGGLCQESKNGLFEYPLESSFLVCDPSGNKFLISSGIKLWKH